MSGMLEGQRKEAVLKHMCLTIALIASFVWAGGGAVTAQELQVGDEAPDFTLPASDGETYTLSELRGQHVVLAWFPKAFTGG